MMEPMLTKQKVTEVMKERGYEFVSENISGGVQSKLNFVKNVNNMRLHASVNLINENVSLSFVELTHFCQLSMENFSFNHPEFEKYEGIILTYVAKCLDIDVMQTLNDFLGNKEEPAEEKPKPVKKTLDEKKAEFWEQVKQAGKEKGYSKDVCFEFYRYWTEHNEDGKKLRWEIAKTKTGTFHIPGRLVTWIGKNKIFDAKFKDKTEKKIEKQLVEAKTWTRHNTANDEF